MNCLGFVYDPIYLKHDPGHGHPERPARLESILRQVAKDSLTFKTFRMKAIVPKKAELFWIEQIHEREYIQRFSRTKENHLDSLDCRVSTSSYEVGLFAVGGVLEGLDQIFLGRVNRVFCAIRPPGHHAEWDRAMGFCFFNHIAIAACYLQKRYGLKKIFILDWDVHHGNGTQHIFERDSSVFYCSLHQDPQTSYPGTGYAWEIGLEAGKNYTLNCPMPIGISDEGYLAVFTDQVVKAICDFEPDFILVSAGFDAHRDDPLGQLSLSEEIFGIMTKELVSLSERYCSGRLLSILEGGYHLRALAGSVSYHLKALL